ncbi:hypothetical protein IFE17_09795 [Actinobacillus sp. GY-402]|nr:hypothetical protein IFE17_09170 [Actinobacillus sp. GY-402]QOF67416.1 hypothetical protein IFE17_09795 [Actinobacillus sp. GY-402]
MKTITKIEPKDAELFYAHCVMFSKKATKEELIAALSRGIKAFEVTKEDGYVSISAELKKHPWELN